MKAIIKYKEGNSHRQKTIEVDKNEPNYIIREFIKSDARLGKWTHIKTVKCGRYMYHWHSSADGAFPSR